MQWVLVEFDDGDREDLDLRLLTDGLKLYDEFKNDDPDFKEKVIDGAVEPHGRIHNANAMNKGQGEDTLNGNSDEDKVEASGVDVSHYTWSKMESAVDAMRRTSIVVEIEEERKQNETQGRGREKAR